MCWAPLSLPLFLPFPLPSFQHGRRPSLISQSFIGRRREGDRRSGERRQGRRDEARGDRGNGERANELTDYITAAGGGRSFGRVGVGGSWSLEAPIKRAVKNNGHPTEAERPADDGGGTDADGRRRQGRGKEGRGCGRTEEGREDDENERQRQRSGSRE